MHSAGDARSMPYRMRHTGHQDWEIRARVLGGAGALVNS